MLAIQQLRGPTDPSGEPEKDLADLRTGAGQWANSPVRACYENLQAAARAHEESLRRAQDSRRGLLARHRSRGGLTTSDTTLQAVESARLYATEPHVRLLEGERARLSSEACQLERAQQARAEFYKAHPDVVDRIDQLRRAIETQQASPRRHRFSAKSAPTPPPIVQR